MPFRISRTLRFWVEAATELQDLRKANDKEVAAILREFERCGDAMRAVNCRGQVIWKASPQMVDQLAQDEKQVDEEWKNEP